MPKALHTVVETPTYLSAAKAAGVSEDERAAIVDKLAIDPSQGVEIVGSGGCRKLRVAGHGKGKSGGYRIVTFYTGVDVPVYLLTMFSKGERDNLSAAEVNTLRTIVRAIMAHRRARRRKA